MILRERDTRRAVLYAFHIRMSCRKRSYRTWTCTRNSDFTKNMHMHTGIYAIARNGNSQPKFSHPQSNALCKQQRDENNFGHFMLLMAFYFFPFSPYRHSLHPEHFIGKIKKKKKVPQSPKIDSIQMENTTLQNCNVNEHEKIADRERKKKP